MGVTLARIVVALATLAALLSIDGTASADHEAEPESGSEAEPEVRAAAGRSQDDYAFHNFGDPWDFSNPSDLLLTPGLGTLGIADPRIADGVLAGTAAPGGSLHLAWSNFEVLRWGRDANLYPIDADRYSVLSFRLHADRDTVGGLLWFPCADAQTTCQGGMPFRVHEGWHDYSLVLEAHPSFGPEEWDGLIRNLRVTLSSTDTVDFAYDWIRLHAPTDDAQLVQGSAGAPQPQVTNPDRSGGADYAAVERGDPWDFASAGDVGQVHDLHLDVGGGEARGVNTSNDGWFELPLGPSIDGSRYHRVSFVATYTGAFSLADTCGGGMNARLVWKLAGRPASEFQDSQDILVVPGRRQYVIDLATSPPSDAADETTSPRIGWAGQQIVFLRVDPHEDRCARNFSIERIRIAEDDAAGPDFTIDVTDRAFEPGTTADVIADDDRTGCDGVTLYEDVPIAAGVNRFPWDGGGVNGGTYWICVRLHDGTYESTVYSSGPVTSPGGGSPPPPPAEARSIEPACPDGEVPEDGYPDVADTHEPAVDCITWWEITRGRGDGTYGGDQPVRRDQMASFLARTVIASGGSLPEGTADFPDIDGNAHADNIRRLASAGLVSGFEDGTYQPERPVTRDQMATFLRRTASYRDAPFATGPDRFTDDDGSVHEPAIDAAAEEGVVAGTSIGTYSPRRDVRRDQMGSFLARLLAHLVDAGAAQPPA